MQIKQSLSQEISKVLYQLKLKYKYEQLQYITSNLESFLIIFENNNSILVPITTLLPQFALYVSPRDDIEYLDRVGNNYVLKETIQIESSRLSIFERISKISIGTVTQLHRFECLKLLCEMINNQTFKTQIIEWIIVDGSETEKDAKKNAKLIQSLTSLIPIVYINPKNIQLAHADQIILQLSTFQQSKYKKFERPKLGQLRNAYNDVAKGDIIVAMDDDDFYPQDFVKYVNDELANSNLLIAGCSNSYIQDITVGRTYQSLNIDVNFTPNNCMAYKNSYLKLGNRYNDQSEFTEELQFINTNKLLQLAPENCTLHICHNRNTYNKRSLFFSTDIGSDKSFKVSQLEKYNDVQSAARAILYYKQIFGMGQLDENDVVFMCGSSSIVWSPDQNNLGGSEQSVVEITSSLSKMGYKITVYANIGKEMEFQGVKYLNAFRFPYDSIFSNLVLWRMYGILQVAIYDLKAKKIFIDLHDTILQKEIIVLFNQFLSRNPTNVFKGFFVKSEFHKMAITEQLENDSIAQNYFVIPNGVRLEILANVNQKIQLRQFRRFCFCSSYDRGLFEILLYIWPKIYQKYPEAELHIYYGLSNVPKILLEKLVPLLSQPGVMEHGKKDISIIAREKCLSNFLLYPYTGNQETDCITLKEAQFLGCIPIIIDQGVFKERHGIKFGNVVSLNSSNANEIVDKISSFIDQPDITNTIRLNIQKSHQCDSWFNVAQKWKIALELPRSNGIK